MAYYATMPTVTASQIDRFEVAELVQRERAARDARQWDEMAACYHPDASIEVSWFSGDAAAFVAASKRNAAGPTLSFHSMAPAVVTLRKDRASAETGCTLHGMTELSGVEIAMTGYSRLLWRAQRVHDRWLIAGLRSYYISDLLLPRNPGRVPALDEAVLATFRPSYRYLSYVIVSRGGAVGNDLPGIDRPETVTALRSAERAWLEHG